MADAKTINMGDQLQTVVREIFAERGYDVEVYFCKRWHRSVFLMDSKGETKLTQDIVDDVINAAVLRIGGTIKE